MQMPRLADIVVARYCEHRNAKIGKELRAEPEVVLIIGAVDCDIAAVEDKIRVLSLDPGSKWSPVRLEVTLTRAEMGVRDMQDTKHEPHPADLERLPKRRLR
jgi:hypothetical protein